jgi:16S rRNA processing protein RimM
MRSRSTSEGGAPDLPARSAGAPGTEGEPEAVVVGAVRRPHGLKGEVLVEVLSDRPERFAPGAELELVQGSRRRTVRVVSARPQGPALRVAFEGVADRDGAEALRDGLLEAPRASVPPAPEGAYWHFELLGCRAYDARAGELGEVVDLVEGGAGLLLAIARPAGGRLLLPFVEEFVVAVDPAAKRIDWRLPEGLIEACASGS